MKLNAYHIILGIAFIFTAGFTVQQQNNFVDPSTEIQVGKTDMITAMKLVGPYDDEFITYACGRSSGSGHISSWYTYKKLGIALLSVDYNPEREDGYKNGLVRDIRIFDTTNLSVFKSKQQRIYYDGYLFISKETVEIVFGRPDRIQNADSVQYLIYTGRQTAFAFNRISNAFVSLYVGQHKGSITQYK